MRKGVLFNAVIMAILVCHSNAGQSASAECEIYNWNKISDLCAQALIYPDDFVKYVKTNISTYSKDTGWIKCSRLLATTLVSTAWTQLPDVEIENRAKEIARDSGYPELWPRIIETTKPLTESKIQLSYFITSISNATLEMMKGNIHKYEETRPYLQMTIIWQFLERTGETTNINILKQLSYKFAVWIILYYSNASER